MILDDISLADFLKENRENHGFSQRELARRTKISNSMICRIESGEIKKPKYQILKKLSDELKLELVEVLILAGYSPEELINFGFIFDYKPIKGYSKIQNYTTISDGYKYLDLVKVLEGYKKNELAIDEVFGLFICRTGIDITKYIIPEQREKYGLNDIIKNHTEKDE